MGRHCAVVGCSNGEYRLNRWMKGTCSLHNNYYACCVCAPPFKLFLFPKNEEDKQRWITLVNRKTNDNKRWMPSTHSRVCSEHFLDGQPSHEHPDPELKLGYTFGLQLLHKRQLSSMLRLDPVSKRRQQSATIDCGSPSEGTDPSATKIVGFEAETVVHQESCADHSYYVRAIYK